MSSTKRHTWRPGDAIDPGATYYPMDGARQGDPLEPDDVIAALDAMAQEIENLRAELDGREKVERPPGWSDAWLGWHGAECSPLPGDTMVQDYDDDGHCRLASAVTWTHVRRFRYQGGWVPRGDWIPPAELWDEGCPVRCEWINATVDSSAVQREQMTPSTWSFATHIRLVARQPQAGLPEGWKLGNGNLYSPRGRLVICRDEGELYGPAAIRQAVDAWLREMGDE